MGVDPYLKLVVGIESQKDDPRFSESWREQILKASNCYYLGEILVPPLIVHDEWGVWSDFDWITSKPLEHVAERPEYNTLFYEGNPAGGYAWKDAGQPVGYIVESSHDQTLLRCLSLVPGFYDLFGENNTGGHITLESRNPKEHPISAMHARGGRDIPGREPSPYQRYKRREFDLAIKENRWIEMFPTYDTKRWYHVAMHLLRNAGWIHVQRQDLRIMVVFDWA